MYPVTQEFNAKIKYRDRQVIGKVQIDYTDPYLDQSISVENNEQANVSYPFQVYDGIKEPKGKYLSLDGSCVLNGTYSLAPAPEQAYLNQMGWWGEQLSSGTGVFTTPYPTLKVSFYNRVINKLQAVGDNKRKEYPVDFEINLYDASNVLLHKETVTGNSSVFWEKTLSSTIQQVEHMELVVFKWSHPNRQVKIIEFFTSVSEIYTDEDGLLKISLLEEMEIDSGGMSFGNVSANEITLELDNSTGKFSQGNIYSPLYNMLKPNRRIKAWLGIPKDIGDPEYVPLGTFWSGDWNAPDNGISVKTVGTDRMEILKSVPYNTTGVLSNITLYDLAIDVFTKAGLEPTEYWVDTILQDYIIPFVNYQEESSTVVLRHIAQVCLGHCYCNRLGVVMLEGVQQSDVYHHSSNESANISYEEQVTNEILESSAKYISLDGSWLLDGSYSFAPPSAMEGEMGWWGSQLSDASGNFMAPYPALTIEFFAKAIGLAKIVGDSSRDEYPVDFDVKIYAGTELISHQVVVGNTSLERMVEIPENPTNTTKLVLEIKKWSSPNKQAKIVELIDLPYRLRITDEDYFKKDNPSQYSDVANIVDVTIQPMNASGQTSQGTKISVRDEESIIDLGQKRVEFPNNPLIQTVELGQEIIEKVLLTSKVSNRNLSLQWRGHPALLLGNEVVVQDKLQDNPYKVIRQTLDYDGGLRCNLTGRKVVE